MLCVACVHVVVVQVQCMHVFTHTHVAYAPAGPAHYSQMQAVGGRGSSSQGRAPAESATGRGTEEHHQ